MNIQKGKTFQILMIMLIIVILLPSLPVTSLKSKSNLTKHGILGDDESEYTTSSATYDLLIISPHIFSKHLQPLICHKNKHNVKTILVDAEEIYHQIFWRGRDKAENQIFHQRCN